MSDQPNEPPRQPVKQVLEKQAIEKIVKTEKAEKFEHKEKPEKYESKEKPEKYEHKEKPEKWEHKEKPEKQEHKELVKIELLEKIVPETGPIGDPGGPVETRLEALEASVAQLNHFITTGQRPDLSRGALNGEPDAKK